MGCGYVGFEYARVKPIRLTRCAGVFFSESFMSMKGSSSDDIGLPALDSVSSAVASVVSAVFVAGSGSESVPVTMSASQSPKPPGAASTAVCGL